MALSESTLATELANMEPTSSESAAATALAQAFADYMDNAVAGTWGGVPINAAAVQAQVSAMAAAVDFEAGDTATEGAQEVRKCFWVLWTAMFTAPATFFTGAIAITPPNYGANGLVAALATTFGENVSIPRDLEDSAAELAADIHPRTDDQASATFPGPIIKLIT
jgi:hypothetical protein